MTHLGVAVEHFFPDTSKTSASGIKLCDHYVLTHVCIIWDIIKEYVVQNNESIFKDKSFKQIEEELTSYAQNLKGSFKIFYPSKASFTEPSKVSFTEPSQVIFTEPSKASFTEPSKVSFTKPSKVIFTKPSKTSLTEPSKVFFTEPSKTSFIEPSKVLFTEPSKASFTEPSKASFTKSNENVENGLDKIEEFCIHEELRTEEYLHTVGIVEKALICPGLLRDFINLFLRKDKWKFDKKDTKTNKNERFLDGIYFSCFLLLRTKEGGRGFNSCVNQFERIATSPEKGATVFIDGCPFGSSSPSVFLNSVSKGIIGNVSVRGNIFLTDARCVLGCEGAPTYIVDERIGVCGIVISPFCWLKGEWIGLTFVAAIIPLLKYLKLSMSTTISTNPERRFLKPKNEDNFHSNIFEFQPTKSLLKDLSEPITIHNVVKIAEKCIVRICTEDHSCWGTGIVVDGSNGIIITCAHVTFGMNKKVHIMFSDGTWQYGFKIYETNPSLNNNAKEKKKVSDFHAWDLAIIRLLQPYPYFLPLSKELPLIGTPLLIGGHPMFRVEYLPAPTFSLGNLAKVCELSASAFEFKYPLVDPNYTQGIANCKNSLTQNRNFFPLNENFICQQWKEYKAIGPYPVLLQTTCAAYCGVSGGPVIACHPYKGPLVIGIISCCATEGNNTFFPHVSMAIPTYILATAVENFSLSNDIESFEILSYKSSAALALWNLEESFPSKL